MEVLLSKLSGSTYNQISRLHQDCSSKVVIERVIKRTACGKYWEPNMSGGGEKILSDLDERLFMRNVEERAKDINCISTYVANLLVYNFQEARIKKAKNILRICNCKNLARQLEPKIPSATYLKAAAKRMGIKVKSMQKLEEARRMGCDKGVISDFFDRYSDLLNRDPRLIFNMDETMVSSNKKLKILCPNGYSGLTVSDHEYPHITACVTIGASGVLMKPFFILPNKKKLNGLEEFQDEAYFASSESGWMNKKVFTHWAMCFLSDILHYKLRLPSHLRKQRILLIMDGHRSRANFFIAKLFAIHGIDILIFPGHTSHLLQPFDVGVASSLKTAYQKELHGYKVELDENGMLKKTGKFNVGAVRKMMIRCLINALHKSALPDNIKKGFEISGIAPLNKNVPLSSQYAMEVPVEIYKFKRIDAINNRCLNNSKESLEYIFKLDLHKDPTDNDFRLDHYEVRMMVKGLHESKGYGWALTPIPDLLIESNGIINRYIVDFNN